MSVLLVRAGDGFVTACTLALALADLVMMREVVEALRLRVPQAIGVKTAAATRIRWARRSILIAQESSRSLRV